MTNYYQILTQSLSISSDDPLFLKAFYDDYQWFEAEDHKNVDMPVGLFDNHLYINDRVIDLSGHPTPGHIAFQLIVSEIMSRLNKNFYLIHAGVLKRDNELIVLSGPSGIGKSTLVKMLLSNQFDYFSDDCAPLHKNSGKIYPFPRSMWIVDNQSSSNAIRKKKCSPLTANAKHAWIQSNLQSLFV
ncbi:MAG: hypothetical protein OMM_02882 [Candidatus Magnetoglobus multicellularis str. Araruama]|uniref:Uncharacterized protein n=1 Tax=Candidatus Magnetoglobus multicellularis str. Araruama TaxID=890399 RepID=A0A1V1P817_9BACT|nr:MAG: hypothetical protein OMM_02882 [Candidatus Magnetoglobus multicellularis str. Araruama]